MTIITLMDDTTYFIDTNDSWIARSIVTYKLLDRSDSRKIKHHQVISNIYMDGYDKYYNSSNQFDGIPLQARNGWSYKWGEKGVHFKRDEKEKAKLKKNLIEFKMVIEISAETLKLFGGLDNFQKLVAYGGIDKLEGKGIPHIVTEASAKLINRYTEVLE